MTTQVSLKPATDANLLERFEETDDSQLVASRSRVAVASRRSWYALGLVLRLVFFVGVVTQTLTLWNQW